MNRKTALLIFLFACSYLCAKKTPFPALCIVPIADLLTQKLTPTSQQTITEGHASVPLSESQPIRLCCRATQLLFNEQVMVIQSGKEQSFVEVPWYHLKTPSKKSPSLKNDRFWILTKNICPLSELSPEVQATLPYAKTREPKSVALIVPWKCPKTEITYSVGTRFVVTKEKKRHYDVKMYNPTSSSIIQSSIPMNSCILEKQRTEKEQRELFVKIVRQWAHGIPHTIPYVLGGASIITTCSDSYFYEEEIKENKRIKTIFKRPDCITTPYSGIDCSGLIRVACNIVGIPLSAINSRSISGTLRKLSQNDTLQNGDLVAWDGHIAVITDTKKGLLVEARGYEHDYGCVQEIPYQAQFKNITTSEELMNAYLKRNPIKRLDKKGTTREIITNLQIVSLFDR